MKENQENIECWDGNVYVLILGRKFGEKCYVVLSYVGTYELMFG